ncbi:hypothetical protein B7463_g12448, partial [Scytalidium lignicola]
MPSMNSIVAMFQATSTTAPSEIRGPDGARVSFISFPSVLPTNPSDWDLKKPLQIPGQGKNEKNRLVEIRAAQRTFEGAYIRTALGQFSFALVVLRIFTQEFYSIGALFAAYGAGVLLVSMYRRYEGQRQFFSEVGEDGLGRKKFRTSGNAVIVLTALSLGAYITLLVLTLDLKGQ